MMHERDYMRISVAGLKVRYNHLSVDDSSSVYLDFGKKKGSVSHQMGQETDSFQALVTAALNRLEVKLDELIGYLERDKHGIDYQYDGVVLDIGGGGLRLRSKGVCPIGALLDLCIFAEYGNTRPIYAIGRVCWIEENDTTAESDCPDESVLGVEFVEINEEAREVLVRMVFHVERRRRQLETQSDQCRVETAGGGGNEPS